MNWRIGGVGDIDGIDPARAALVGIGLAAGLIERHRVPGAGGGHGSLERQRRGVARAGVDLERGGDRGMPGGTKGAGVVVRVPVTGAPMTRLPVAVAP